MKITRYAYVNTASTRGAPERVELDSHEVSAARVWTNGYGNPTYVLELVDGRDLVCVDDYGALNDLGQVPVTFCKTRRELVQFIRPS